MQPKTIIQKYLDKFGITDKPSPDLEFLDKLQFTHLQAFPFENLTPFCGETPKLDLESLTDKFLNHQRSGYCFEQNLLFKHILEELGFQVKGLGARVLWNAEIDSITRKSHMLLLVELNDKKYITDVGFGGSNFSSPLVLEPDLIQKTRFEAYKITKWEDDFILQVNMKDAWKPVYRFNTDENYLPDYEVNNWYLSNYPESHFVKTLMVAGVKADKRLTLHNHVFKTYFESGKVEVEEFSNAEEIIRVLEKHFNLKFEESEQLTAFINKKIEF